MVLGADRFSWFNWFDWFYWLVDEPPGPRANSTHAVFSLSGERGNWFVGVARMDQEQIASILSEV